MHGFAKENIADKQRRGNLEQMKEDGLNRMLKGISLLDDVAPSRGKKWESPHESIMEL